MKFSFGLFKKKNIIITGVSQWVVNQASQSPILNDLNPLVVHNGVDKNVFSPKPYSELSNKYNLKKEIVILYVTAYFETEINGHKGGRYIIELAELLKKQNVKIIVAANYGSGTGLPENVFYHGRTKTQLELAQLYSMADVTVITSVRETFSMPVAESLCCGTPVVGFNAGGPESIALKDYSEFVEYGNIDKLYTAITKWMNVKREKPEELSKMHQKALSQYSNEKMTDNYLEIYNKLV
jgi:glycosyltransferase involved in cell wall biosynthesis